MTLGSRRLIEHGFASDKLSKDYPAFKSAKDALKKKILNNIEKKAKKSKKDLFEQYANHDSFEIARDQIMTVDYPKPVNRYYLIYEADHVSIEPMYYWLLGHLQYDWGFPVVHKVTDIFTASEHSSFYGASAQRLGLAQDKVQQYLATIGQFVRKDLFQLVRDLRWIDERLKFHEDARKGLSSADITLKGIWTDVVDGVVQGNRVSPNIFQLSQQLQFKSLPDWFFAKHPQRTEYIDKMAEAIQTTRVNKDILKRKWQQYLGWREENYKELKHRKNFELRYLRQHVNIIKMYMAWLKPYMRHIERLRADVTKVERADLIASFEGSMVEIEVLAQKIPEGNKDFYTCIVATFEYRARPKMEFHAEGYQHRGPVHVGELKLSMRNYAWTEDEIKSYIAMKDKEDIEMLKNIDSSIKATMDALGGDFEKYLKEAGEVVEQEIADEVKQKPESIFQPFVEIGKGFKDMTTVFIPKGRKPAKPKQEKERFTAEKKKAQKDGKKIMWQCYKNFKKAHRMITW